MHRCPSAWPVFAFGAFCQAMLPNALFDADVAATLETSNRDLKPHSLGAGEADSELKPRYV
jgi:hypothetical protein